MPVPKGGKVPNYPKKRRPKELPDWRGRTFGRLSIIEFSGMDKNRSRTWLCRCICGTDRVVSSRNLTNGNTQSCGCLAREVRSVTAKRTLSHVVLPYGVASRNSVVCRYKGHGQVWALSTEQAEALLVSECHYCGAPPSNTAKRRTSNGEFMYNGIDRIDNTRGYEPDNVVSCCRRCNVAKNDMSYDEFLDWVGRVYWRSSQGRTMARAS